MIGEPYCTGADYSNGPMHPFSGRAICFVQINSGDFGDEAHLGCFKGR